MSLLIAAILFLAHQAEPLEALDASLGAGIILQKTGTEGLGQEVFGGPLLEISYAQKHESAWIELGVSGIAGGGFGMNSGLINEEIRGGGIHLDGSYSLLRTSYLDLKIGAGAGAKYLQRVRENNEMDNGYHLRRVSRQSRNFFQVCGRGRMAINIHGKNGIGGLEIRPINAELGPSFFDFMPSWAIYWPI